MKILKSISVLLFSIKRMSLRLYHLVFQRLNGLFVRRFSRPPNSEDASIKSISLMSLISILKMIHRKPTRIELRVEDEMQELEAALKQRQPQNKKALNTIVNPANQFLRLQAQSSLYPEKSRFIND